MTRYRCTNSECLRREEFLDPAEVVTWSGARYHAYERQGALLDPAAHRTNVIPLHRDRPAPPPFPLPCGPVAELDGPCRIRLRRTKGWRKPEGVIVCTRPGRFGNPINLGGRRASVEWFAVALAMRREGTLSPGHVMWRYPSDDEVRARLAGADLACWCPLDGPCHVDELLRLANDAG